MVNIFLIVGITWRPTGKKFTLGKLNCGYQWRPTGKKFALGELCPLTRLRDMLCPFDYPPATIIPPTDKDLEILFQPMFDEYFDQSTDSEPVPTATVVNAPIVSTNTSVSTMIAQDAPSTSHSLSSSQVHPPVFPQGVAAGPTIEDTSITQADLILSLHLSMMDIVVFLRTTRFSKSRGILLTKQKYALETLKGKYGMDLSDPVYTQCDSIETDEIMGCSVFEKKYIGKLFVSGDSC
ncbi:hypothetical protein Tco_0236237 [Tanacetum coccineum]